MAKIELLNIAHTYEPAAAEPLYALNDLNLAWEDGGTYALLGPSGCGKTTMLNIISGLVRPTQGRVLFDGVDCTDLQTAKRNIAQVFQFPVIYTLMNVEENLAFPLVCRNVLQKERTRRVQEVAELLNLQDKLKRPARKLTFDEKQLISLGRGLVRDNVTALLLDEPLTVMDPQMKFELRRKLKSINERFGLTMVYVTHDQNEAMTFADSILVMYEGNVVQAGTSQELYDQPQTTYVGNFIGSPAMNFISCTHEHGKLWTSGGPISIPEGLCVPEGADNLKIGFRPRYAGLAASEQPLGLKGVVQKVQEFGNFLVVSVALQNEKIRLKLQPGSEIPPGDVWVVLPEDHICLYADDALVCKKQE